MFTGRTLCPQRRAVQIRRLARQGHPGLVLDLDIRRFLIFGVEFDLNSYVRLEDEFHAEAC